MSLRRPGGWDFFSLFFIHTKTNSLLNLSPFGRYLTVVSAFGLVLNGELTSHLSQVRDYRARSTKLGSWKDN
jgi:hypothetical protein